VNTFRMPTLSRYFNRTFSFLILGKAGLVVALLLSSAHPLCAQVAGTGSIQGLVKDVSGAVIPGATVTAINIGTNAKQVQQSSSAGFFSMSALPPGEYVVTATAPGFETLTQQHVMVDALAIVTLNASLQAGSVETIVVEAAQPMLDVADATIGSSIRNNLYTALPLALNAGPRDPTAFVSLVPGVQAVTNVPAGTAYASFNGGQPYQNEIYVEGMPQPSGAVGGETRFLSLSISVEAVDQFQVETNNPPAMYQGQGTENYTLKSGTNQFHGSVYEFFRNTVLDAAGYFATTTPVEQQNEFGASIGGPIKRNKLFFYGGYDGYYYNSTTLPAYQSIASLKERLGDFSELIPAGTNCNTTPLGGCIFDPNTTICNSAGTSCSRTAFPGNIIPANRIAAVSSSFQSYLPTPSLPGVQNNYLAVQPIKLHVSNTTDRVDWHISDRHLVYGFFSHGQYTTIGIAGITPGRDTLPLPYADSRIVDEVPTSAQVHDVYTIHPNLLNQFGYSFNRLWIPIESATAAGAYPQKAGLTGLPAGLASLQFPSITFSGANAPINWADQATTAQTDAFNGFTVEDNVQWVRGRHSVTVGTQLGWIQVNQNSPLTGTGASFTFAPAQTSGFTKAGALSSAYGNSYASFLLGTTNSGAVTQNAVVTTGGRWKQDAVYIQDDFKFNSKLTLNAGLRYDIFGVFHEVLNRLSNFNPNIPNPAIGGALGALQFSGNGPYSCNCATQVKTHYDSFGPRIGMAFALNPKTVIRAGFAIMYGQQGALGGRNYIGTGQLGYTSSPGFTSVGNGAPAFFWNKNPGVPTAYASIYQGGVPPYTPPPNISPSVNTGNYVGQPTAGPGTITYGDPQIGGLPATYENISFGVQRSITQNMTFSATYSASLGHHITDTLGRPGVSTQINPVYLALGSLLNATASPANVAAAAAIFPGIKLPYATYTGAIGQMLTPFPQYSSVTDTFENIGDANYNSLILTLRQQLHSGLTFNFSYVRSKELDDIASARTAYNHLLEYGYGTIDRPNVVTANFSYALPFGAGHRLGNSTLASALVGGWQVSGIYTYSSGTPLSITSTSCNTPYTGGVCIPNPNPSFSGSVRLNGGPAKPKGPVSGVSYISAGAFAAPAPYVFGTLTRSAPFGLRGAAIWDQDLTVRRQFGITERFKFIFSASAFNVFNVVSFGGVTTSINSSAFGQVSTQQNNPRRLQLDARISF
jgi:Carboxypeptidase regulatory-like domain/TonB dependent receptor